MRAQFCNNRWYGSLHRVTTLTLGLQRERNILFLSLILIFSIGRAVVRAIALQFFWQLSNYFCPNNGIFPPPPLVMSHPGRGFVNKFVPSEHKPSLKCICFPPTDMSCGRCHYQGKYMGMIDVSIWNRNVWGIRSLVKNAVTQLRLPAGHIFELRSARESYQIDIGVAKYKSTMSEATPRCLIGATLSTPPCVDSYAGFVAPILYPPICKRAWPVANGLSRGNLNTQLRSRVLQRRQTCKRMQKGKIVYDILHIAWVTG